MMVNCPRCGFSQPQDQYCARCGVDMVSFKPAEKPLLQKVIGNTAFQITVLVLIVVSVFSIARRQRHRELAERIAEIENARNSQILSSTSSTHGKNEMASSAAMQPRPVANPPPASSQPVALGSPLPSHEAKPPGGEAPSGAPGFVSASDEAKAAGSGSSGRTAKAAANLVITFWEVQGSSIKELLRGTDPALGSSQTPFVSGVIQGMSSRIQALQSAGGSEQLDSISNSIKAAQPAMFMSGQRDESSGQLLGFVVEAHPSQLDENESHIQLRVWRYLREANNQVDEFAVPLPESFTVPNGAAIYITGTHLLPRRNLSEIERRFYDPLKVLHMLTTEEFRQGLTDLLIMIEPR